MRKKSVRIQSQQKSTHSDKIYSYVATIIIIIIMHTDKNTYLYIYSL